ncbi:MAG: phosphoglycerate dehydrogenase, partial [Rhodobacteraceae bacterium]|nr:phosphoglycerate dehydrogenase [Paracoccaceae bacterium]
LGQTLGENGVNIANFTLGRAAAGGDAIALLYLDERLPEPARQQLIATGKFTSVRPLEFNVA